MLPRRDFLMQQSEPVFIVGRKTLARKLGVSPDMISELVANGTIPVFRFMKKKWAFRWADVEAALQGFSRRGSDPLKGADASARPAEPPGTNRDHL